MIRMRIVLDTAHVTFLHYRIKQSGSVPLSKQKLITLIEIVTFSSVHDIYCLANIFDPDQAKQNKEPDQDPNCLVLWSHS